jgi:hypothetical protein
LPETAIIGPGLFLLIEPVNDAIESELAAIYLFAPTAVVRREPQYFSNWVET